MYPFQKKIKEMGSFLILLLGKNLRRRITTHIFVVK
jgi:hypothetical protein